MKGLLIPGWILLLAIAALASFCSQIVVLGGKHPVEVSALAILLGIGIRNFNWMPVLCSPGVKFSEKFLALGIVLMGAGLNFQVVSKQAPHILLIILLTMLTGFFLIFYLGKLVSLSPVLSLLLAIGTTICGTTAIAIIAPLVQAPEEETSYAIGTVALFGLLAILTYPALGHFLGMTDLSFGIFAGTAIHSTPQVVGAGFIFSDMAGEVATATKLVRNCFIAPLALVLALVYSQRTVNILAVFPWFLFGYFVMAFAATEGFFHPKLISNLSELGKFLILLGMAGIGLNTRFAAFSEVGLKPLLVGLLGTVIVASVSLGMIGLFF